MWNSPSLYITLFLVLGFWDILYRCVFPPKIIISGMFDGKLIARIYVRYALYASVLVWCLFFGWWWFALVYGLTAILVKMYTTSVIVNRLNKELEDWSFRYRRWASIHRYTETRTAEFINTTGARPTMRKDWQDNYRDVLCNVYALRGVMVVSVLSALLWVILWVHHG